LNQEYTGVRSKIMEAVHQTRPGVLVSFNWIYTPRQPETPPAEVGFLMCDIFPEDQLFAASYLGKYWATLGKPFDIMDTAFLRWWGDWGFKPAVALQQECATILANGGKTWIGFQMPPQFGAEPGRMQVIGETMRFLEQREKYCRDAEPIPYIAV
jgi:hypothetical protein